MKNSKNFELDNRILRMVDDLAKKYDISEIEAISLGVIALTYNYLPADPKYFLKSWRLKK